MPFKSEKQRRYMWANHPEIARRWAKEGKGYVQGKRKRRKRRSSRKGKKRSKK